MLRELLTCDLNDEMPANRTDQNNKCVICDLCTVNFSFGISLMKCLQTEQLTTESASSVFSDPVKLSSSSLFCFALPFFFFRSINF